MKKFFPLFIISTLLLVFTSCTIKEWDPPEWDVTLEIPVINETVYMHELEDSTENYIIRLDNDTLHFSISEDIETKNVGDELKIDGQAEILEKEVGDKLSIKDHEEVFGITVGDSLKLNGRTDIFSSEIGERLKINARDNSFSIDVGDSLKIPSQSSLFTHQLDKIEVQETGNSYSTVHVLEFVRSQIPGTGPIYNQPIPPIYTAPPIDTLFTIFENDNLEYAAIDSGFAYIRFTNNTELPLSSTDPNYYMRFEIYSGTIPYYRSEPIVTYEIDHIVNPSATELVEIDLSGKQIYRENYLRVQLTTDGTNGQPIDVLESHNFAIEFSVSDMVVSHASARLPQQRIIQNESISIQDTQQEIFLVSATIDSCMGNILVNNDLPINAHVTVDFVELFDASGNPYHLSFDVNANAQEIIIPVDLKNFQIHAPPKNVIDSLIFTYKVITDSTDDYVTIDESMSVSSNLQFGKMQFSEVTGYIDQDFSKDDSLSVEDSTGELVIEEALLRSGLLNIDLSMLSYTPEITIEFDEIFTPPDYTQQLVLTNDFLDNYDLANHRFYISSDQLIHYHINAQMPGHSQLITITSTDEIQADIHISELIFEEVTGKLNNKTFSKDQTISIEDNTGEISIEYAKIKSADNSFILFHNAFPYDMDGSVIFQDLKFPSGLPYTFTFSVLGNESYTEILDLTNCIIEDTKSIDSLHFTFEITLNGAGSIQYSDSAWAEFILGDVYFEEIHGTIDKEFTTEGSISTEDTTITLQNALIQQGTFIINLSGIVLENPTEVILTFDEIFTPPPGNIPLEIVITENFNHFEYDFTDHTITPSTDSLALHYTAVVDLNQPIELSSDDMVSADIQIKDLIFNSVIGKFNSMTLKDVKSVAVDSTGEYSLVYAEIDSCDVHVTIPQEHYTLPFGANIQVKFEEIFDAFGDTLIIDLCCPGDTTFSFEGYTIGSDPISTSPIDSLYYSYTVTTEPTAGYVTVNYEDEVRAEIELGEMMFNNIRGIINHKQFEMDDIQEDLDIENLPDSIANVLTFQNAELHLDVYNGTGFNCWLNINMVGYNDEGDSAVVSIDETSGIILPEQMNHIVITEGVSEMLSIVPTHVRATNPYAVIGNGVTIGEISKTDSISGSYTLETPFKFIINNHTVKLDSLNHLELDETTRDAIRDNLNGVLLNLTAENRLPFGSNLELWLAADSSEVWTNPELVIDSFYVAPATIDPVHHTSGDMVTSTIEILLDKVQGDFSVFENPDVYVGTKMHIIGSDGEVVIIRGSDNLHLFGYVSVDVHVQEQDGGDK